jgi:hypothetical protein
MHNILIRKLKGKIPFGRPRHKWENNIKMYLKGMGFEGVDWIQLAQVRVHLWRL